MPEPCFYLAMFARTQTPIKFRVVDTQGLANEITLLVDRYGMLEWIQRLP